MRLARCLICAMVLATAQIAAAHEGHPAPTNPPAPGYSALPYAAPAPGTYTLPPVGDAPDGAVVDAGGSATTLHTLFADRLVVLSFIYTHCADPDGCPLATFVLSQLAAQLGQDKALASRTRLVSISFDPARDTPEVLEAYAKPFRKPGVDWRFVAPPDATALAPILSGYGQSVIRDPDGTAYSHQLRVYLIDAAGRIRNQYSAAYLHAETVLADLRTLALDVQPKAETVSGEITHGAGDVKKGYASPDYQTQSRALATRTGKALDLRAGIVSPPRGLPGPSALNGPIPTDVQIALGRRLFFDRRLSHNDTIACASCHVPDQGFTSNELTTPVGIEGRTVRRNAPALYNVGYQRRLFHDARESRLEYQIWGPMLAANEMGNPSIGYVLDELAGLDDYAARFTDAFGPPGLTIETLGAALAAYERGLMSANSAFDRWYYGGETKAMSATAREGFEIFRGKGHCTACHTIEKDAALFTDQALHNTGIGYRRSMQTEIPKKVLVAPGTALDVAPEVITSASEVPLNDLGRYEVSRDPADRWRYKTPSLRNVALTAPYMHDGSLPDLRAVVEFYNRGGIQNEGLDPLITPLGLSATEMSALVEFMQSLTGDNVDALMRDAFAQPIGDRRR